jgi:hypothetical protein
MVDFQNSQEIMKMYETLEMRDYGKSFTFSPEELNSLLSAKEYLLGSNKFLNETLTSINAVLDSGYPLFEDMIKRCVFRERPCDKDWCIN